MVRKLIVTSGQFDLRHMTSHALAFGNRTRLGSDLSSSVACLTFRVVIDRLRHDLLVWVVAREATDACIVRVVTLASCEAIWLKANVRDAWISLLRNFRPGPMTTTAEVGYLLC